MALIDKKLYTMSMPKAMSRGYAIPLDASSVWYNYDEMVAYAKNNGVAYIGQILSLIDESNDNKVAAYIITDEAGTLQKIGTATLGDNETIVLDENTNALGLNNWGKKYYKWIASTEETEGHYEEVEVDNVNHFWINNLEPRTLKAENGFELAWYEPNPSTLEGVEDAIAALQASVSGIIEEIGTEEDTEEVGSLYSALNKAEAKIEENSNAINTLQEDSTKHLATTGGTMTGDIVLPDASKAASEKVVDIKIATAIGSAGHLKRAIVDALPTVEEADIETIYMVKDVLAFRDDKYEEFMVIEGEWAQIGDTSVDLTNYVQKIASATEGNLAALDANGALIDAGVLAQDVINHLTNKVVHITADERIAWNEGAAQAATNTEAIVALVKISQDDADKLADLPAIREIGNNLTLIDGVLSVVGGGTESDYVLPIATQESLGGVKIGAGLSIDNGGLVGLKVSSDQANGLIMASNGLSLTLATETTAGALSPELFTKLNNLAADGEANVIEGALLGTNNILAPINENKQLILSFAEKDKPGLVVSSDEDNSISVNAATGIMAVNRIATTNLYVPQGEELILTSGSSFLD